VETPAKPWPPAVVLGLNANGLGVVRSLRKAGIRVIGVERAPSGPGEAHTWMSSATWSCKKVLVEKGTNHRGFLEALQRIARDHSGPIPVIPSGDNFLLFLDRHQDQLSPSFRFHLPDPDTLDLLMQKGRSYEFCVENDIPVPHTLQGIKGDDVPTHVLDRMRPPYLVKPQIRDPAWDDKYSPVKALTAQSREELLDTLRDAGETGCDLLVQEIIPGPDSELYFSHGYFDEDSGPVALWTGRKLRQYPPRFGTSTLTEAVWVPEVAHITKKIARGLGLRGYVNVEFKLDRRDGKFKLIEVTPSRTWYPHYLGVALGINLPELWYRDLLEWTLEPERAVQGPERICWIDEYRDLVAAVEAMQRGELTAAEWLRSLARIRSFALFKPMDPLPGLKVAARLGLSFFRRLRGRPQLHR